MAEASVCFFFFWWKVCFRARGTTLKVIAINFESNGVIKVLTNQLVDGFNQVHSRQTVPNLGKSVPADDLVQVQGDVSWVLKCE
jgi:hypothetical protein